MGLAALSGPRENVQVQLFTGGYLAVISEVMIKTQEGVVEQK